MFQARLKLPASFSNDDVVSLGEGIDALACSAMRDDNHRSHAWTVEWLFENKPDARDLSARLAIQAAVHTISIPDSLIFEIETTPDRDWLAYSYKQFPAFEAGPFFIYGAHHDDGDDVQIPDRLIGLQINAATAFGSGEHGTTKGCLLALEGLKEQGLCPWNILDMGTGSGILGIAAWKLWKAPVLAVDNDAQAVAVADYNRGINGVPSGGTDMVCAVGEGFAADIVAAKKPFELVIANILAGPLKEMAGDCAAMMDENGYAVLSGILNEQATRVIAVYEAHGFALRDQAVIGDWTTLVLNYRG